jgi:hypothetical protein
MFFELRRVVPGQKLLQAIRIRNTNLGIDFDVFAIHDGRDESATEVGRAADRINADLFGKPFPDLARGLLCTARGPRDWRFLTLMRS